MNDTEEMKGFTKAKTMKEQEKATTNEVLQSLLEVVSENLVAIYEVEERSIIMRILNGQKFRISIEEIQG